MLLSLDGTGLGLMEGTYPEYRELDFLNHFLTPGMVFIDVGANQGIYTVVGARGGNVWSCLCI